MSDRYDLIDAITHLAEEIVDEVRQETGGETSGNRS